MVHRVVQDHRAVCAGGAYARTCRPSVGLGRVGPRPLRKGRRVMWQPEQELRDAVWEAYLEARDHPEIKVWVQDARDPLTPVVWMRVDPAAPFTVPGEGEL